VLLVSGRASFELTQKAVLAVGPGFVDGAGQADRVTEVSHHGLDPALAQCARGPLRSCQSRDLMFSGGQCGGGHRAQITSRAGDENLQDLFLSQPFPG
jgi:hypothetical protein